MYELVIAYLVLLYGSNGSSIIHHRGHLCRLGSWSCTDIEDRFTHCRCECEYWEHRGDRLEVDLAIVECSSSFDSVFMYSVEYIDSCESSKVLCYDSFFLKFFEYISSISLQGIDTKRAFSWIGKGFNNSWIVGSKDNIQTRLEFFWKWL